MIAELYTKPNCNYCTMAKQLLSQANVPYTERSLDVHFTREFVMERFPTAKTYPIVVLDGFYIGGANELAQYLEETTAKYNSNQLLNEG